MCLCESVIWRKAKTRSNIFELLHEDFNNQVFEKKACKLANYHYSTIIGIVNDSLINLVVLRATTVR